MVSFVYFFDFLCEFVSLFSFLFRFFFVSSLLSFALIYKRIRSCRLRFVLCCSFVIVNVFLTLFRLRIFDVLLFAYLCLRCLDHSNSMYLLSLRNARSFSYRRISENKKSLGNAFRLFVCFHRSFECIHDASEINFTGKS